MTNLTSAAELYFCYDEYAINGHVDKFRITLDLIETILELNVVLWIDMQFCKE